MSVFRFIASLICAALAFPALAPAAPAAPELWFERGTSAQASFVSRDGPVTTFFWVAGFDYQRMIGAVNPVREEIAYGSMAVINNATGAQQHAGCNPAGWDPGPGFDNPPLVPEGDLFIANNLQSAVLNTTFDCQVFGLVSVDLTWSANGVFGGRGGYVFGLAPRATGTVTDGIRNFTPLPSDPVETSIWRYPY